MWAFRHKEMLATETKADLRVVGKNRPPVVERDGKSHLHDCSLSTVRKCVWSGVECTFLGHLSSAPSA